ncbi:uncharacterized protein LOC118740022 [Rhagoletis pomonella]|uniref:uncharacterized protein LOC118740022 n=1 Tax=Rhagoletis pomonella TaxID=28610 RepID=UPI0017841598|nr:uncharacterized protein LOC118740022 [Rhagoletis pomonella]
MDDARFRENFRLDRRAFQKVCEKVRNIEKIDSNLRRCIPLKKRVAIALFSLGSVAEYKTVSSLFGVGRSTVGEIVLDFCHSACCILHNFLKLENDEVSSVWMQDAAEYGSARNQPNHTTRVGENDLTAAAIRNAIAMSFQDVEAAVEDMFEVSSGEELATTKAVTKFEAMVTVKFQSPSGDPTSRLFSVSVKELQSVTIRNFNPCKYILILFKA